MLSLLGSLSCVVNGIPVFSGCHCCLPLSLSLSSLLTDPGFAQSDNTRALGIDSICIHTGFVGRQVRGFSLSSSPITIPLFLRVCLHLFHTKSIFLLLSGLPRTIIDALSLLRLKKSPSQ